VYVLLHLTDMQIKKISQFFGFLCVSDLFHIQKIGEQKFENELFSFGDEMYRDEMIREGMF
jgi:hypothetical protein